MQPVAGTDYVEAWLAGPSSHQFYTRTYPATFPKAVILFVHGFAEHVGRYEHIHVKYPPRNITIFAFDMRGYGRTALDVEHKSKDSAYGKTSWVAQATDIEHFGKHLAKQYPGVPLFLMGHSAGGAAVLAYFTRSSSPPSAEGKKLFTAAIASSPCITITEPKPKILRWVGSKLALLAPSMPFPAVVPSEDLSRNTAANELAAKDPLIKRFGTLRGLDDMLTGGEKLLAEDYKKWPKDLPIFFVHGTQDKVTSCKSTQEFCRKIDCTDKKISLYEGAYHEIVHEIDGMPDRLLEECISWVETHLPKAPESNDTDGPIVADGAASAPTSKL